MANMTFGVNLVPSANNTYSLGNSDKKWNLFANTINANELNGNLHINNVIPIDTKTYTTSLYNSSSEANYYQNFISVAPVDYNAIWIVRYKLTVTASGYSNYTAIYDVSISGRSNSCYSYRCYNSLVNYPIHSHAYLRSNSSSAPHELGVKIAGSYGETNVTKTLKVELLEQDNCTVTLLDSLKLYTSSTPSGYAGWSTFNASSNGLWEQGDSNDTAQYICSNGFRMIAGANKIWRYTLFGRTADGSYESFVTSNSTETSKTKNINGFLPDEKIYYNPNNTDYSGAVGVTIYEQYHSIDYRYSFNITTTGIPAGAYTYIKWSYNTTNGLLYLPDDWFATSLPSFEDGYIYQRIGSNYYGSVEYRGSLLLNNPYYKYENGGIQVWHATTLSSLTGADDLKAIEAISGTSGLLKKTAANTWSLDTSSYVTSSGVTSLTIKTTSPLSGGSNTAITSTGTYTLSLADNYGDTKNPYASKTKNYVLAAPSDANGAPSFRTLVAADIPNLSWNKITSNKPTTLSGYGITDAVKTVTSTDNAIVRFDGTAGQVQNSGVTIDDSNNITIPGTLKITTEAGAKYILLGNQNSTGVDCPVILQGVNGSLYIGNGTSWSGNGGTLSTAIFMSKDRKVGIGTTSPSYALSVNGDVSATNFRGALIGNVTGNVTGNAGTVTTTADTSNVLYLIGVTSAATTTLKRDTSITMQDGIITASTYKVTANATITYNTTSGCVEIIV